MNIMRNYENRLVLRKGRTVLIFPKDLNSKSDNKLYILNNYLRDKIFRKEEKIYPMRNKS